MKRCIQTLLLLAAACACVALIKPATNFSADDDAKKIKDAFSDGDDNILTDIYTRRSSDQRVAIARAYNQIFDKDLINDFKFRLSGDFEDLMIAMTMPTSEFNARELYDESQPWVRDTDTVADIIATSSNKLLNETEKKFPELKLIPSKESLRNILTYHISDPKRDMIIAAFAGMRDESQTINMEVVDEDVKFIHNFGEVKNEDARTNSEYWRFERIYTNRTYSHLREVFNAYEKAYGHSIERAFKSLNQKEVFAKMFYAAALPAKYFARHLHSAMDGWGTNDRVLIRIIVNRSEIDLDDIKAAYQAEFGETLESRIEDETSGDYCRTLLKIVNS